MTTTSKDKITAKYMLMGLFLGAFTGFVGSGWGIDWVHFKQRETQIYREANIYVETRCAERMSSDRILSLRFESSNGIHTLNCQDFEKKETCVLDSEVKPTSDKR